MICTPTCSVCYKNYSENVIPVTLQPCGHGNCSECANRIIESDNPSCPLCRASVVKHVPNYDLIEITEKVKLDTSFWGRRLMETVSIPGQTIEISEKIKPFCKILYCRLALEDMLKKIDVVMTLDETKEMDGDRVLEISGSIVDGEDKKDRG